MYQGHVDRKENPLEKCLNLMDEYHFYCDHQEGGGVQGTLLSGMEVRGGLGSDSNFKSLTSL